MANPVTLTPGQEFKFTTRKVLGNAKEVNLPYPELVAQAKEGQQIFIDDGQMEFRIERADGTDITTKVMVGGVLSSYKGIAMPGSTIDLPAVTEADIAALEFGLKVGVDWVAASFVRAAADLEAFRKIMEKNGRRVPLMAKIERREAVECIEEIIEAADGVMVARGDLGVELPLERVPGIQKKIIEKTNVAGKPVVTATQMLDSMIRNRRPTRAEVTDVANAIYDGTDAVMLSGETAVGCFPVESVAMMARIAEETESSLDYRALWADRARQATKNVTEAIAESAVGMALELGARAIVTPTSSGATARAVSKYRPECMIVGAARYKNVYRQLAVSWGVYPILVPRVRNTDRMVEQAVAGARQAGLVQIGDRVIVTAGVPPGVPGRTNLIMVQVVGYSIDAGLVGKTRGRD